MKGGWWREAGEEPSRKGGDPRLLVRKESLWRMMMRWWEGGEGDEECLGSQ